ncbi:MAG: type II secretion system F family protein [Candidatus Micrarchaeaceae archaeon]
MSRYIRYTAVLLSLISVAAVMLRFYVGITLAAISIALYYYERRRLIAIKNSEVLSFINDFADSYRLKGTLYGALKETSGHGYSFSRNLNAFLKSYELGLKPSDAVEIHSPESKPIREFMRVIATSMESGQEVGDFLDAFKSRISEEEAISNMVISKTLSMKSLSRLGIIIFFPLFAGISASILGNSSAIAGSGSIAGRFSTIAIAYIVIMLTINHALDNIGSPGSAVLYKMLPSLNVAVVIFYATMHFLPRLLW